MRRNTRKALDKALKKANGVEKPKAEEVQTAKMLEKASAALKRFWTPTVEIDAEKDIQRQLEALEDTHKKITKVRFNGFDYLVPDDEQMLDVQEVMYRAREAWFEKKMKNALPRMYDKAFLQPYVDFQPLAWVSATLAPQSMGNMAFSGHFPGSPFSNPPISYPPIPKHPAEERAELLQRDLDAKTEELGSYLMQEAKLLEENRKLRERIEELEGKKE